MLGFSKASGPGSQLRSASSKMRSRQEPTSSRPTLSSSTASTNYAEPSKPNKPAHVAPAPSPGTLQPHRRSCSGGASDLPTSCRPRQRFPRVPSSEPDPTLMARGHHERAGNIAVFRSSSERLPNRYSTENTRQAAGETPNVSSVSALVGLVIWPSPDKSQFEALCDLCAPAVSSIWATFRRECRAGQGSRCRIPRQGHPVVLRLGAR